MTDHTTAEQKANMRTFTRDDTEHGTDYVLRSDADELERELADLRRKCRDLSAELSRVDSMIDEMRDSLDIAYAKGREEGRACIPASVPESCKWTLTDEDMWESACGAAWTFVDGGPTENGMRFCLACGRVLEVVAPKPGDGNE